MIKTQHCPNCEARQAVIDAIEANAALDDFPDCEEYTQGLRDGKERALAAINAISAVIVTDDMVERAAKAVGQNLYVESNLEVARAVLRAALGE